MNQSSSISPQQLEQAFQMFNMASSDLCVAYEELRQQAQVLSRELELANGKLRRQFAEKEALLESMARKERLASMGEMAARLAHQLRTPLATALLYASQLGETSLPMAERTRFASKTVERLRDLEHLIGDMLQFVRGVGAQYQRVSVTELLGDAFLTMEPQARTGELTMELLDQSCGRTLHADRLALSATLLSLLDNAVRACAPGGHITLEATVDDAELAIRVSDTGVGITPATQARLFEPFFTTRSGGTGLGLAIVRAAVEAHAGRIEVQSTPGSGSQFVLYLPLAELSGNVTKHTPDVNGALNDIPATAGC
jgi:two-component system sensor histidine kinase FlrB